MNTAKTIGIIVAVLGCASTAYIGETNGVESGTDIQPVTFEEQLVPMTEHFVDINKMVETQEPTHFMVSPEELELVERVVAAEARGESLEGQMAVAQTIKDRSDLWGMTLTEVVTQPHQFAKPYSGTVSELTKEAVRRVLDGERIFGGEFITHFCEAGTKPYWTKNKSLVGSAGGHDFFY